MNLKEFANTLKEHEKGLDTFFALEYLADKNEDERELLAYIFMNTLSTETSKKVVNAFKENKGTIRYSLLRSGDG